MCYSEPTLDLNTITMEFNPADFDSDEETRDVVSGAKEAYYDNLSLKTFASMHDDISERRKDVAVRKKTASFTASTPGVTRRVNYWAASWRHWIFNVKGKRHVSSFLSILILS